ncbi:MAG: phosphatidylglycerol lysyltransferase domain-containing protein [Prevotellaceae bacterium]|jgi:hypothetical protein|nr:phosphatidylglycerol lysyltransferase domain-containing protein [Prevotellaceae bacterium]
MLSFSPLTVNNKAIIQPFLLNSGRRSCDVSFSNLCSWQFLYHTEFALQDDQLFIRYLIDNKHFFMMPLGSGALYGTLQTLLAEAHAFGDYLRLQGLDLASKEAVEAEMPNQFAWRAKREYADYLYLREDLVTLSGKKFQPKRNHINQFLRLFPQYEYVIFTPDVARECLTLDWLWARISLLHTDSATLEAERQSLTFALTHFDQLDLLGGALRVNGNIVAFTIGTPINTTVFDICVEKADTAVMGAYAMINHEFARRLPETVIYINREEDLGIEGLRKAKMSYHPIELLDKYTGKYLLSAL